MKTKVIILMLLAVQVLQSCGKQDAGDVIAGPAKASKLPDELNMVIAANPVNPYDRYGQLHNQIVEAAWKYVQQTGDTSRKGKSEAVKRYCQVTLGIKVTGQLSELPQQVTLSYSNSGFQYDRKLILPEAVPYLDRIFASLFALHTGGGYEKFKSDVTRIENDIVANYKLPEKIRERLLIATAIGRYSLFYWQQKAPLPADGQVTAKGIFSKIAKALVCTGEDICGAAVSLSDMDNGPGMILMDAADRSANMAWLIGKV